jgi:hypothetical protein
MRPLARSLCGEGRSRIWDSRAVVRQRTALGEAFRPMDRSRGHAGG